MKISILTLAIGCILILSAEIYKKVLTKDKLSERITIMPDFIFYDEKGMPVSNSDFQKTNCKVIIIFFDPECEHCQYMVRSLLKSGQKLNNAILLMISLADAQKLKDFKNEFHLDSIKNIKLLRDQKIEFPKIFGTSMVPSFFIYKNGRLIKKIFGETRIENLLNDN